MKRSKPAMGGGGGGRGDRELPCEQWFLQVGRGQGERNEGRGSASSVEKLLLQL